MSYIDDQAKGGITPTHHDTHMKDGIPLENRITRVGVDIVGVNDGKGQAGQPRTAKEPHDITGWTVWKRNSRSLNGCRQGWAVVVVGPRGEVTAPSDTPGPTTPGGPGASTGQGWDEMGQATTPGGAWTGSGSPAGAVPEGDASGYRDPTPQHDPGILGSA